MGCNCSRRNSVNSPTVNSYAAQPILEPAAAVVAQSPPTVADPWGDVSLPDREPAYLNDFYLDRADCGADPQPAPPALPPPHRLPPLLRWARLAQLLRSLRTAQLRFHVYGERLKKVDKQLRRALTRLD
jgi:hypothetical protein